MGKKFGSTKPDTRVLGVVDISDSFFSEDSLRLALMRLASHNATAEDKRVIRNARNNGINLDEIMATTAEGLQRHFTLLDSNTNVDGKEGKQEDSETQEERKPIVFSTFDSEVALLKEREKGIGVVIRSADQVVFEPENFGEGIGEVIVVEESYLPPGITEVARRNFISAQEPTEEDLEKLSERRSELLFFNKPSLREF